MRLTDISVIRRTLEARGFHFSRLRGQNFLVDAAVPERIAALFDKGQAVLEIGPGFGALTEALCRHAEQVTAVETDSRLLPILRDNLKGVENLTLIEGDALRIPLDEILPEPPAALCSNLPYSITTPLLTRFLEETGLDPIVVMVQREAAERMTARPGTPEYGAFTLFCNMHVRTEMLFEVPPGCFVPQPKVFSSVIRMTRHTAPPVPPEAKKKVERLYRAAFAQRRKTLLNALAAGMGQTKPEITAALEKAGIDPGVRGETLSLDDYIRIAEHFS